MLKGVVRGEKRPPRMVIYGPPKVGKTTLASDAPSPIFVCTEDGADGIAVDQYPRATTWAELLANVHAVAGEKHEYQTLVVDTMNGAAELCEQHICLTQFKGDWGPTGFANYGKGPASVSEEIRVLLAELDKCRVRGMTILLTAHVGILSIQNPLGNDYSKFAPDLDKKVWARVSAWADIIGRAEYETSLLAKDPTRKAKAVSDTTVRVLRFDGNTANDGGCRVGYELPAELPLSWAAIAEHLGKKSDTTEQIVALWNLYSPEEKAKALAYLGIKALTDIEQAQVQRAKTVLNKLIARQNAAQEMK